MDFYLGALTAVGVVVAIVAAVVLFFYWPVKDET